MRRANSARAAALAHGAKKPSAIRSKRPVAECATAPHRYPLKRVALGKRQAPGGGTTHRVDLLPLPKRHGRTPMVYNGKVIGASNSPIYAAARWPLDNGLAWLMTLSKPIAAKRFA